MRGFKDTLMTWRIEESIAKNIEEIAKKENTTKSEVIRTAIEEFIEKYNNGDK